MYALMYLIAYCFFFFNPDSPSVLAKGLQGRAVGTPPHPTQHYGVTVASPPVTPRRGGRRGGRLRPRTAAPPRTPGVAPTDTPELDIVARRAASATPRTGERDFLLCFFFLLF
jgi:hypothetical protein